MSFIKELIQENEVIWQSYLKHPFIKEMAKGQLDINIYRHYLIEDTLYLKEFGRIYAYALYRSKTLEQMRYLYEMLSVVQKNESYSRIQHLKQLGEDIEAIENRAPNSINQEYTQYLLDIARQGELVDVLAASLPCMVGYHYIAKTYVKNQPEVLQHPMYGCWFNDYSNENYQYYCQRWSDLFDRLAQSASNEQKQKLRKIFKDCSSHELKFWDMSYQGGKKNV